MLRLSILSRWVHGNPAGSTASEQLFSNAGLFDTAKRGQVNIEAFKLFTLHKVNQDTLENISYVSANEKSVDDPDRVSISKESACELSDGEEEEQFPDCFEEGSDSSREWSTADETEDDDE